MLKRWIGFARMKIERRSRWDKWWRPVDALLIEIETRFWLHRGYTVIECLGDSHIASFRRLNWMYPNTKWKFRTVSVLGATAYGISKANSSTGARELFDKRIRKAGNKANVLISLGEIDASFLIWFLARQKNRSTEELYQESLSRYLNYLNYIKQNVRNLIVCSAPLPTIRDGEQNPEAILLRDELIVSHRLRTDMVLRINKAVNKFCDQNGIEYLDMDSIALDADTQLVNQLLARQGARDHHYVEEEYVKLLMQKLPFLSVLAAERVKGEDQ